MYMYIQLHAYVDKLKYTHSRVLGLPSTCIENEMAKILKSNQSRNSSRNYKSYEQMG